MFGTNRYLSGELFVNVGLSKMIGRRDMDSKIHKMPSFRLVALFACTSLASGAASEEPIILQDKTLVAWASPVNLSQSGGSILTIDDGKKHFDGIVFGELAPARWMAGSDCWRRTEKKQGAWPAETEDTDSFVQIAITYRGTQVAIYRNGVEYAQYTIKEPQLFGADSTVLIGPRHAGNGDFFEGTVADARVYDRALTDVEIAALKPGIEGGVRPWAWWTFDGTEAVERTGRFSKPRLVGGAKVENGQLILDGKGAALIAGQSTAYPVSPLHFRPEEGNVGDVIAYYWQEQYHLFYLHGPQWAHIVSADLIHWQELPPALEPCADPQGPDPTCWTGSIVEHDGVFYLFYTGQNRGGPINDQKVMLATSRDLIHWKKQPEFTFYPDGKIYWNRTINGSTEVRYHDQAFRDPDVFWNEQERQWWMLLHAMALDEMRGCSALYSSPDLLSWTPREPLIRGASEDCPHAAPVQGHWFIMGGQSRYISAGNPSGPYPRDASDPLFQSLDGPDLLVPKSLFDGDRRLIWGWVRDLKGNRDSGKPMWGGTLSMARELYSSPGGTQLFERPAAEMTAAFPETVLDSSTHPSPLNPVGAWLYVDGKLCSPSEGSCRFKVPDDYMLQCTVQLAPAATLTIGLRQQADGAGYPLVVNPAKQEVRITRAGTRYARSVPLDLSLPVSIQAFVQGTIIEFFVNDRYAFTQRCYDFTSGDLGLSVVGGSMEVLDLSIKTLAPSVAANSPDLRKYP